MKNAEQKESKIRSARRGSTIITVLVAVAFVSVLVVILLFTTFNNLQMKNVERQSKRTFYNADTIMNEIRVGLERAVSDSIAQAYTDVYVDYSNSANSETVFQTRFVDALYAWKLNGAELFDKTAEIYHTEKLMDFISEPAGVDLSRSEGAVAIEDKALVLKGVTVRFAKNGYESNITSDIVVNFPEISYTKADLLRASAQDFALIANTELFQNQGGELSIAGNAFAGKVTLSGAGNKLSLVGSNSLVCQKEFITQTSAAAEVESGASLWAKRIGANGSGSLSLLGSSFVEDDLELAGANAKVTLGGSYMGFGSSLTDPAQSSSIIVNGAATRLDLTRLKSLMLAGQSFIGGTENISVMMGESLSVKSDQLAYLVPASSIRNLDITAHQGTNPMIFSTTAVPAAEELLAAVNTASPVFAGGMSMNEYGADVQLVYSTLPGNQTLVYFYMNFETTAEANDYFADYFAKNSALIKQYMQLYSESLSISTSTLESLSGNGVFYKSNGDVSLINPTQASLFGVADRLKTMFGNLCTTLTTTTKGTGTVYENFVNTDEVATLPYGETFFGNAGGSEVAVICRGDIALNSAFLAAHPELKIIVATGNVTLASEFSGLVIAGGRIDLRASVAKDREGVTAALLSSSEAEGALADYLRLGTISETGGGGDETVNWDLSTLVTYRNWSKH